MVRFLGWPKKIQKIISKMTEFDYKNIIENKGNNSRFCGDLTSLIGIIPLDKMHSRLVMNRK